MGFVEIVPARSFRRSKFAALRPCKPFVGADPCGNDMGIFFSFGEMFLAEIENRSVLQKNRTVRRGYGNLYCFAPCHAAVMRYADKRAAVREFFRNRAVHIQYAAGAAPRIADCVPVMDSVVRDRMAEPGHENGLAAETDHTGIAVVEPCVVDDHRDRPRFAFVPALEENGLAERADVGYAEARAYRIQGAFVVLAYRRPAVVAEEGIRVVPDDPVFVLFTDFHRMSSLWNICHSV